MDLRNLLLDHRPKRSRLDHELFAVPSLKKPRSSRTSQSLNRFHFFRPRPLPSAQYRDWTRLSKLATFQSKFFPLQSTVQQSDIRGFILPSKTPGSHAPFPEAVPNPRPCFSSLDQYAILKHGFLSSVYSCIPLGTREEPCISQHFTTTFHF